MLLIFNKFRDPEDFNVEKIWITKVGFPAVVAVVNKSHRAGYVAVGPGHDLYGMLCDDVHFDVHGGISYASSELGDLYFCDDHDKDRIFWIGFDCAHYGDCLSEAYKKNIPGEKVCTLEYVQEECESLAKQLMEYRCHKTRLF